MKPRCLRLTFLVVGSWVGSLLNAQEASSVSPGTRNDSKLRSAIGALIREDLQKNGIAQPTTTEEVAESPADVVVLERLVVQYEKRIPALIAPRESQVAKVLRTGTIKQDVGEKITTRLWTSGDAGVVLSFRW